MGDLTVRYRLMLGVSMGLFAVLVARLFDLQVIHHRHYDAIAAENRIQIAVDMARRGQIRDRQGRILAHNEPSYSVYLLRSKATPLAATVGRLARVLEQDSVTLLETVRTSKLPYFEAVRMARHVPLEKVCRIEEQTEWLPGTMLRHETTRRYPAPWGGGHVLGYLGESAGDAQAGGIPVGSFVGVRGVERRYDEFLRGIDGVVYYDVTAAGQVVGPSRDLAASLSIPGSALELTVDWDLQAFCAEALGRRGNGSVVSLHPKTGEILALVNHPSFDPNLFSGILKKEVWNTVASDTSHPLLDRSIHGLYPPGSTTKLVTAAAGLETGIAAPSTRFGSCFGGMAFGNRFFRCWKATGHGSLDMAGAIEQSCDVYFYQLAQRLGVERWAKFARESGFGARTRIDLPDESAGLVPDSAYYNRRYGRRRWTPTLVLNLGIGQGELLVTPLQLAVYFGAVANGGVAMQPHVLKSIEVPGSSPVAHSPRVLYRLPYAPATLRVLQEAARRVVAAPTGTARGLNYKDLEVAGKTGTAQNPHGENHSWFACYAPAHDPELVVVVLVENAGQGSEVAAPLAGEVLRRYFGLPPVPARPPAVQSPPPPDTLPHVDAGWGF